MIGVCLRVAKAHLRPVHNLYCSRRGKQRADIDEHIEQGESCIALLSIAGVVVEVAHHNLQITLEHTCSEADKNQGCSHCRSSHGATTQRNGQKQIAEEHYENTDYHHA